MGTARSGARCTASPYTLTKKKRKAPRARSTPTPPSVLQIPRILVRLAGFDAGSRPLSPPLAAGSDGPSAPRTGLWSNTAPTFLD